jgi:hypothetical protein
LVALTAALGTSQAWADDTGTSTTVSTGTQANTNANNANATTDEKITDVLENKGQSYYFLGANYRITTIPAFMINLFVDQGPTGIVGSSTAGLSIDIRKDHFSIVPGINFSKYDLDPTIFTEKGKSGVGNTTVVNVNMQAIYVTVDLLWSVPIAKQGQVDFEFGFSVGIGGVWGDLYNTWVSDGPTGGTMYKGQDGTPYYQCVATGPNGCNAAQHQNSTVNKVGSGKGYREPGWFDSPSGSVPSILPWIELPILGLRFKPIKQLEMRLQTGFSVTGFFFNFAGYYGFESTKSTPK